MQIEDKHDFIEALSLCCSTQRQPLPESDSLKFWFKLLAPYPLADVKAALIHFMRTQTYVRAPVPADVIAYIDKRIDCWVTDNEAWAIASRSHAKPGEREANTVVTCNEIDQALDAVRHLLDDGDKFNASRAFKDAYIRIVDVARQKQHNPRWRVSLGTDQSQHEVVIGKAVNEGRITLADGRAACPLLKGPDDDKPMDPAIAVANRSKVADVLAALAKPRAHKAAPDMAADVAATREASAEQARKAAEYVKTQRQQKDDAEAFRRLLTMIDLPADELAASIRAMAAERGVA